jgi:hypothetical protein
MNIVSYDDTCAIQTYIVPLSVDSTYDLPAELKWFFDEGRAKSAEYKKKISGTTYYLRCAVTKGSKEDELLVQLMDMLHFVDKHSEIKIRKAHAIVAPALLGRFFFFCPVSWNFWVRISNSGFPLLTRKFQKSEILKPEIPKTGNFKPRNYKNWKFEVNKYKS